MVNISRVTLLCVETRDPELAHWAIDQCLKGTSFAKVVLITNVDLVKNKRSNIEYSQAPPIATTKDYSNFLLTGIERYVEGSHVLVIQWDSFITNPTLWRDEFLEYDYIGAVWPHHPENPVGNGGFSLRSVKLLQALQHPGFIKRHPEDYCICADNKEFLEKECAIKFAPVYVAEQFSVERSEWHDAFGFHGFFNFGKVLTDEGLQIFLLTAPHLTFNNLDAFELIDDLIKESRGSIAIMLLGRTRFSWRLRWQCLRMFFIRFRL